MGGAVIEEILDIVAGGEDAGAAGDDEATHVRIVLRGVDGFAHREVHLVGDRVLLLGAPQRDHARVLVVGNDQVLGHAAVPEKAGDGAAAGESLGDILHDVGRGPNRRTEFPQAGWY